MPPLITDGKREKCQHGAIGYFFQSRLQDCIRRNDRRTGKAKLPAKAIAATSNKLEMPSREEMDEIIDKYYNTTTKKNFLLEDEKVTETVSDAESEILDMIEQAVKQEN